MDNPHQQKKKKYKKIKTEKKTEPFFIIVMNFN